MHDAPLAGIAPEADALDIVVADPDGVVMTVPDRIVWVSHARQRLSRRTDQRKKKRPSQRWSEVVTGDFHAVALERDLVIRQRNGLHARDRLWLSLDPGRQNQKKHA